MTPKLRVLVQQANAEGKWSDLGIISMEARDKSRPFSTGGVGFYGSQKLTLPSAVDGADKSHQLGINFSEIGSKPTKA